IGASGSGVTLNLGAFTRGSHATVNFIGSSGNTITTSNLTTTNLTNGILGGWALAGNDWATVNASNQIVAYTGYTDLATGNITSAATTNVRLTAATTYGLTNTGATTCDINSLLYTNAGNGTLNIGSTTTLRL